MNLLDLSFRVFLMMARCASNCFHRPTMRLVSHRLALACVTLGLLPVRDFECSAMGREVGLEGTIGDPLSNFEPTSISVAELGTFIQTQFNQPVSALELMTTASWISLARAIMHGESDDDENSTETNAMPTGTALEQSSTGSVARCLLSPTRSKTIMGGSGA